PAPHLPLPPSLHPRSRPRPDPHPGDFSSRLAHPCIFPRRLLRRHLAHASRPQSPARPHPHPALPLLAPSLRPYPRRLRDLRLHPAPRQLRRVPPHRHPADGPHLGLRCPPLRSPAQHLPPP